MGPGLSHAGARYLESRAVVMVALDNPFTDPVNEGQLKGKAPCPPGMPDGFPYGVHHYNLTQAGIYQFQNANLTALAQDEVWLSCTIALPLRLRGGCGDGDHGDVHALALDDARQIARRADDDPRARIASDLLARHVEQGSARQVRIIRMARRADAIDLRRGPRRAPTPWHRAALPHRHARVCADAGLRV